jgi:hypothetical protein
MSMFHQATSMVNIQESLFPLYWYEGMAFVSESASKLLRDERHA